MGKLFGKAPSDYFEIENSYFNLSIDLACTLAYMEDENHNYKESQKTAQDEAGAIGSVLEQHREELTGRG